ncbi:Scr1 family TA system antitoxin-like transcriptional regulator [Streptomyces sp. NPDC001709]
MNDLTGHALSHYLSYESGTTRLQGRILSENGPQLQMILDEAALRRQVGGPTTMVRQLEFLKGLATRRKADLRALPLTA